jgi:hypothetical protein
LSHLDNTITYASKQYRTPKKQKEKQRKRNAKHIHFDSTACALQ